MFLKTRLPFVISTCLMKLGSVFLSPDPRQWSFVLTKGNSWAGNFRVIAEELRSRGVTRIHIIDFNREALNQEAVEQDGLAYHAAPTIISIFAVLRSKATFCQARMPRLIHPGSWLRGRRYY